MPLTRPKLLRPLAAAGLALLATLAVLLVARHPAPLPVPASGAVVARGRTTDDLIAQYQLAIRRRPRRAELWAALAAEYLQKVRDNGDTSFYVRANGALGRALNLDSHDASALTVMGVLALARHDFRGGLTWGEAAHRAAPLVVEPLGVLVDADVELGRYAAAASVLQRMVHLQPALSSYARVSYFRELHGDLGGALTAMRAAVSASGDAPENIAYVQTLLGGLEFAVGNLSAARAAYDQALARFPSYVPASAGLAQLDAVSGHYRAAIARYRDAVDRLPLPQYVVGLGETEIAAGRAAAARRDLALVRVEERLLRANGVNTDVDLALFEANHGSPARAIVLGRRAWAQAPSVRSADALGWALTRAGHPAAGLAWARRALSIGSADPLFLYHAGVAAAASGHRAQARGYLGRALARNPRFALLFAGAARRLQRSL
jgi:tetratricopeptide (TPR) repeat protein